MLEINRLYRIIGKCQREIVRLENHEPVQAASSQAADATEGAPQAQPQARGNTFVNGYMAIALVPLAGILLFYALKRRR